MAAVGKHSADILSFCGGNHRHKSKIIWSRGRQPSALVEVLSAVSGASKWAR
jgi:hypothetical protein